MNTTHRSKLRLKTSGTLSTHCCVMALSFLFLLSSECFAFTPHHHSSSSSSRRSPLILSVSSSTPAPESSTLPTVEFIDPQTGCEVVLLGCFHGTESSSRDVRQVVTPDTDVVVLELCETRINDLNHWMEEEKNRENKKDTTSDDKPWLIAYLEMIRTTMQQRGIATGLAAAVLGGISGMQTALSGFSPGLEFKTALECAQKYQCSVVLADQDVDETLRKVGRLPLISWEMIRQENAMEGYKEHVTTLRRAVFGPDENKEALHSVRLGQALVRSAAAVQDLVRLTIPPTFLYFLFLQALLANSPTLLDQASADMDIAFDSAMVYSPTIQEMIPHWIASIGILSSSFVGLILPSVRVILTERDICLTEGIQQACRQAGKNGRVVAVLGMLHVNGVASRMMDSKNNNDPSEADTI